MPLVAGQLCSAVAGCVRICYMHAGAARQLAGGLGCVLRPESLCALLCHISSSWSVCAVHPCSFGIMMYEVFTRQSAYARMLYGQIYHQVRPACTDSSTQGCVVEQYVAKLIEKIKSNCCCLHTPSSIWWGPFARAVTLAPGFASAAL
jgi:hypothetical protein